MIDDRGYVAQALFERLGQEGVNYRVLGDRRAYPERAPPEVQIAVRLEALTGMPRALARFAQELDLQLVHLAPLARAWRAVFAWSDELGRPRFMRVRVCSDYCGGPRCYVRAEELIGGAPDALFAYGLTDAIDAGELSAERAIWLSSLWMEDPRGGLERVARLWRRHVRLIAHAANHSEWDSVRANLATLRRALRRPVLPEPGDLVAYFAARSRNLAQPAQAAVAFMGRESALRAEVMRQVSHDLAPLQLRFFEARTHAPRAGLRIVFDAHQENPDVVSVDSARGLAAIVVEVERAILRWLECRVERRYPRALVGENPWAARILQFAVRHAIPGIQSYFNCHIGCALGSPVLMPYPFGIVIERGARIGSRVTLMNQVSLLGGPVIEDNVTIGAGARVIGAVRIGRGARIGPNAVVTEDVPSHDTIVVEKRRSDRKNVVNV